MENKILPRVVLGMGTGRCGTYTLHKILAEQNNTASFHEGFGFPWEPDYLIFYEAILNLLINFNTKIVSNIGWYWINYVGRIMNTLEDPRCICLQRPRDEVVDSFERYLPDENKWTDPDSVSWKPRKYIISADRHMWPKYDAPRTQALALYWNEYNDRAYFWQTRLPANFMIMDMHEALNTEDGQHRMLSFLGYPEAEHKIFLNQKLNTPAKPKGTLNG